MKISLKLLTVALFFTSAFQLNAQTTYKFGHINSQELLQSLPESQEAQKKLEEEGKSIQQTIEGMTVEYNKKVADYVENEKLPAGDPKKWSDLVKTDKENALQDLQKRAQEFNGNAQKQIQAKRDELFKPILQKVDKAIKEVAKENHFTYIFDVTTLLYHSEESIDITTMVKAKLAAVK